MYQWQDSILHLIACGGLQKHAEECYHAAHNAHFAARTPTAFLNIPYIDKAKEMLILINSTLEKLCFLLVKVFLNLNLEQYKEQ